MMTQRDLAEKAGVGIHFIRDLEQGKKTLRMDKVNQVLALFGMKLGPVKEEIREIGRGVGLFTSEILRLVSLKGAGQDIGSVISMSILPALIPNP